MLGADEGLLVGMVGVVVVGLMVGCVGCVVGLLVGESEGNMDDFITIFQNVPLPLL